VIEKPAETAPQAGAVAFGVTRSFAGRRWLLKSVDAALENALLREFPPVVARLLALRGIGLAEAADYLAPKLKNLLPDPLVLKDMDLAVARIARALNAGERIAVFGDYDVDGSTSAALLSDFLSVLGAAPRVYIPDRMTEGYGPSPAAMRALHVEGASLAITVDCGAAATVALQEAAARVAPRNRLPSRHNLPKPCGCTSSTAASSTSRPRACSGIT